MSYNKSVKLFGINDNGPGEYIGSGRIRRFRDTGIQIIEYFINPIKDPCGFIIYYND